MAVLTPSTATRTPTPTRSHRPSARPAHRLAPGRLRHPAALTESGLSGDRARGHPARYEARVGDNHHHAVCRRCGAIATSIAPPARHPCLTAPPPHGSSTRRRSSTGARARPAPPQTSPEEEFTKEDSALSQYRKDPKVTDAAVGSTPSMPPDASCPVIHGLTRPTGVGEPGVVAQSVST